MELFATVFIDKVEAACFPDCCCQSHHPVVAALSFPQWHQPGPCSGTHLLHSSDRRVRLTHSLTHSTGIRGIYIWLNLHSLLIHLFVSVTPRVPDVSSILAPGGRTPRYTHTPRNALSSLVRHTLFYWCIYILLNKWKREFFALPLFSMTQRMVSLCQWCRKLSLMWKYRQQKKTYWLVWVLFR